MLLCSRVAIICTAALPSEEISESAVRIRTVFICPFGIVNETRNKKQETPAHPCGCTCFSVECRPFLFLISPQYTSSLDLPQQAHHTALAITASARAPVQKEYVCFIVYMLA